VAKKRRKTPRSKEAVLADVNKVVRLVRDDHLTLRAALDKVGLSDNTWHHNRPEGMQMRRSSDEVERDAKRVHALVQKGVSIEDATKRIGLKRSVYHLALKRLGIPRDGTTGTVRADRLPPRPEKGPGRGGYQKLSVPPDMNSVTSLATRIGLIDKKLETVKGLAKDRKTYAKRLMELLRKG